MVECIHDLHLLLDIFLQERSLLDMLLVDSFDSIRFPLLGCEEHFSKGSFAQPLRDFVALSLQRHSNIGRELLGVLSHSSNKVWKILN